MSDVMTLDALLTKSPTMAFTIIRNDTMLYEYYRNDLDTSSIVTTFSVAKSFTATLLGIAIAEGKIKGIDESITNWFPDLGQKSPKLKNVTLRNLLEMKSGVKNKGAHHYYYGKNIERALSKSRYGYKPDSNFRYDNANTQMLGMVVEKATGKSLAQYLEEKIWKPIGAEYDLTWSVDSRKNNQIKAFCCMNGRLRDFAKFGRLYLNKGNWNGKQLVPEDWVRLSAMQDPVEYSASRYKMHWWLGNREYNTFYANGLYNQYIWVYPKKNIVICRFAEKNNETDSHFQDILNEIVDQL